MKRSYHCLGCEAKFSLNYDEDVYDEDVHCPMCGDPIDDNINELRFDSDRPVFGDDGYYYEEDEDEFR